MAYVVSSSAILVIPFSTFNMASDSMTTAPVNAGTIRLPAFAPNESLTWFQNAIPA